MRRLRLYIGGFFDKGWSKRLRRKSASRRSAYKDGNSRGTQSVTMGTCYCRIFVFSPIRERLSFMCVLKNARWSELFRSPHYCVFHNEIVVLLRKIPECFIYFEYLREHFQLASREKQSHVASRIPPIGCVCCSQRNKLDFVFLKSCHLGIFLSG